MEGEPERARGGDGPHPALRPPLQQGPDDLRGLRRARSASCGCATAADLRPADPARDGLVEAGPLGEPVFVVFNPRSGQGTGRAPRPARARGAGPPRRHLEHALTAQRGRRGAAGRAARSRAASARSWPWAATAPGATSRTASCGPASRRRSAWCPAAPAATSPSRSASPPRTSPACAAIVHDGQRARDRRRPHRGQVLPEHAPASATTSR